MLVLASAVRCGICGGPFVDGQDIDVDHVIPVAWFRARRLAVDHSLANLQAAHASCNRGGRPPRSRPTQRGDIFT
jgi:5-methylcytosine-specific restriction endonuclease McrA